MSRGALEGAVSGIVATLAMSGFMAIGQKLGLLGEAPPRKLVRRTLARAGLGRPPREVLGVATALAHVGFGATMGALYSLLSLATRDQRFHHPRSSGALFGLGVWAANYAGIIPKLGLMAPPDRDRPGRPTTMVLAHLVYGHILGTATSSLRRATPR